MDDSRIQPASSVPPIGSQVIWHKSVDSTNTLAMQLATGKAAPHGLVVVAEHQTAGRGRRGRTWVEPEGSSLLASVVLRPRVAPERAGQIMLLSGVAATAAVKESTGLDARLKWPNDVLVGGKKVSGILIETSVDEGGIVVAVVGIGINCNQRKEDFAPDLREQATSLAIELGRPVDRSEVLASLVRELALYYDQFLRGRSNDILADWRERSATLGQRVVVTGPDEVWQGTARDVTEQGLLVVERDDGVTKCVSAGDVSLRPANS